MWSLGLFYELCGMLFYELGIYEYHKPSYFEVTLG